MSGHCHAAEGRIHIVHVLLVQTLFSKPQSLAEAGNLSSGPGKLGFQSFRGRFQ